MGGREHTKSRVIRIRKANNIQQKALNNSTYRRGPRTHTRTHTQIPRNGPRRSLLKTSSSRKGELKTRAGLDLSTSCGLRRAGPAGLKPATTMPLQVPGTEDEGRTSTSTRADKVASASRQDQVIRDDPADKNQLPLSRIAPNNYSLLLQRGGAASSDPLSLTGRF